MGEKFVIGRKIYNGLIWTSAGTWGYGLIQFITIVVLTRLLSPAAFGQAAATMVLFTFGALFSQIGVSQSIVQISLLKIEHIKTGLTISIVQGVIFGLVVFNYATNIAMIFKMEDIVHLVEIIAIVIPVQSFSIISEALLQRELKFRELALANLIGQFLGYGIVAICLALLGYEAISLVVGYAVYILIKAILQFNFRKHSLKVGIGINETKELLYFGFGQTIARFCNQIALQGDYFITGRWLGAEALGFYTRAYQLMALPATVIGSAIDKVLFPSMARYQHDKEELKTWFLNTSGIIALLTVPISVFSVVLAPELVIVMFGENWRETIPLFQIFSIGIFFRTSYKISDSLARAVGAVYKRAWRQFCYASFVIIGAMVGKTWGLDGVAKGVLVAVILNYLFMSQLSLNILNSSFLSLIKVHLPTVFLSSIFSVVLIVLTNYLRHIDTSPLCTLLGAFMVFVGGAAILVYYKPRILIGNEGLWLMQSIKKQQQ